MSQIKRYAYRITQGTIQHAMVGLRFPYMSVWIVAIEMKYRVESAEENCVSM